MVGAAFPQPLRGRSLIALACGGVLAVVAATAAPSSALLPGPTGGVDTAVAAVVLALAFAAGFVAPVPGFYGVLALTALEGAIRKWVVNDVVVFLLKDFLLIGVYAAVLPRLSRRELRRPLVLVVPLALLLLLALAQAARNPSHTGALIGLRSYLVYVPLLWLAPAIVDGERRARQLLGLVVGLGVLESGLGIVQALAGPGVLNRLVSGAQPALLTVGNHVYLRPPGTFMQVGNLSDFLVFVVLTALALVSWKRGAWSRTLAIVAFVFLGGALVYTASRTLLISTLVVLVPALLVLLFRRRWTAAAIGPAGIAVGLALMLGVFPLVNAHVWPTVGNWLGLRSVPLAQRHLVPLRVYYGASVPAELRGDLEGIHRRADGLLTIRTLDPKGQEFEVQVSRVDLHRHRGYAVARHAVLIAAIGKPTANSAVAGGFLGRATDVQTAGGAGNSGGLWHDRVRPQLKLLEQQRFKGHGTGTMTLGLEYANPGGRLVAESSYVKVAWELGLAGFALFVLVVSALFVLSLRGFLLSSGWENACAAVGFGAAVLVPLWMVFTFALDFPIVAELYYVFVGIAVAAAGRSRRVGAV